MGQDMANQGQLNLTDEDLPMDFVVLRTLVGCVMVCTSEIITLTLEEFYNSQNNIHCTHKIWLKHLKCNDEEFGSHRCENQLPGFASSRRQTSSARWAEGEIDHCFSF